MKRGNDLNPSQRILLITFAISPTEGSESGAGWALLRAHLSLGHEVVLVTRDSELAYLKESEEFANFPVKVISVPEFNFLYKYGALTPFSIQVRHLLWNFRILQQVLAITNEDSEVVVHYGTYAGDWNLNVLHFLKSATYKLWGPVGGAQKIPFRFLHTLGMMGILEDLSKRIIGSMFRALTRKRIAGPKSMVLCANSATHDIYSKSVRAMVAQNIVLYDLNPPPIARKKELVFGCGRLIPWKNWKLAILAMEHAENKVLIIAGDGPDFKRLNKIIAKHSLQEKVSLVGKIERSHVIKYLQECDAFIFPSLRDSASWALAEAVALNCRIIALDVPGSVAIAGDSGAHLISAKGSKIIERFGNAIDQRVFAIEAIAKFDQSRLANALKDSISQLKTTK